MSVTRSPTGMATRSRGARITGTNTVDDNEITNQVVNLNEAGSSSGGINTEETLRPGSPSGGSTENQPINQEKIASDPNTALLEQILAMLDKAGLNVNRDNSVVNRESKLDEPQLKELEGDTNQDLGYRNDNNPRVNIQAPEFVPRRYGGTELPIGNYGLRNPGGAEFDGCRVGYKEEFTNTARQQYLMNKTQRNLERNYTDDLINLDDDVYLNQMSPIRNHDMVKQTDQGIKIMRSWGLRFDGEKNGISVSDFLFRVETHKNRHHMDWDVIVDNFHLLIAGRADEFFWQLLRKEKSRRSNLTWGKLSGAFINQFQTSSSDIEVMRDLLGMKQGREESYDSLYNRFVRLHSQLEVPLMEIQMVEILRGVLREEIKQLIFSAEIYDTDQLRSIVIRAERQLKTIRPNYVSYAQRSVPTRGVAEIQSENPEPQVVTTIAEVQQSNRTNRLKCWNCDSDGHGYMMCDKERRVFCYRCGKKDVVLPNCEKCNPGNSNARGNSTGTGLLQPTHPVNNSWRNRRR